MKDAVKKTVKTLIQSVKKCFNNGEIKHSIVEWFNKKKIAIAPELIYKPNTLTIKISSGAHIAPYKIHVKTKKSIKNQFNLKK